jgi:hypothetical protein
MIEWKTFEAILSRLPHGFFIRNRSLRSGGFKKVPLKDNIRCMWWLMQRNELSEQQRMVDLLVNKKEFDVTEPKDHVYPLLGLAVDSAQFPAPEYSLSCEAIYTPIAQRLVAQGRGSEVIAFARLQCKALELPSWVPDWIQYDGLQLPHQYCKIWNAGGDCSGHFEADVNGSDLSVRGVVIDNITFYSDPIQYNLDTLRATWLWILSAAEMIQRHASQ